MKGSYLKIFISAIIVAGILCLIAGIIIYFAVDGIDGLFVGIAFIMAGAADTIISLLVLLFVVLKEKADKNTLQTKDGKIEDKKD